MSQQQDSPPPGDPAPRDAGEPRRAPGTAPDPPPPVPPQGQWPTPQPGPPPPGYRPAPGYDPGAPGFRQPPPGYGQPPPGYESPPPGYGQAPQPWQQVPPLRPEEERLWSTLTHLSYFVFGLIVPLIVMVALGNRSPYVRHHAVEALNFHITVWIAAFVAGLSILLVIGVLLLPLVLIAGAVFSVIGAVKAYQGVPYRYPLSIRLVR
jgi:uncharacterized protein